MAFIDELDVNCHWCRMFILNVDSFSMKLVLFWDLLEDEYYNDLGFSVFC